jgi:hypothetical protein
LLVHYCIFIQHTWAQDNKRVIVNEGRGYILLHFMHCYFARI